MRFLANENFPEAAIGAVAAAGHDIVSVRISASGLSDSEVLAWAAREQRTLLIFDKDFGELAGKASLPVGCGVILFRMPMPKPVDVGRQLAALIAARDDWPWHFSVIQPGRVRMRKLR